MDHGPLSHREFKNLGFTVLINTGSSIRVPAEAVNMVNAVKLPSFIKPVKDEKTITRNPNATDAALKTMAFPVMLIPSLTAFSGPFVMNPCFTPWSR